MLYCKRKKYDPRYLWTRELSSTGQYHYHFILLLNGSRIQNANILILEKATQSWQRCLGIENGQGLVDLCISQYKNYYYDDRYGGVRIRRNDPNLQPIYGACFQVASYLAKRYSKGSSPAYVNETGHSKLK
jgi:hypothetical protein